VVVVPAVLVETLLRSGNLALVVRQCRVPSLERQPSTQPVAVVPTETDLDLMVVLELVVMVLVLTTPLQQQVQ
jgi:hypothetical protein